MNIFNGSSLGKHALFNTSAFLLLSIVSTAHKFGIANNINNILMNFNFNDWSLIAIDVILKSS